MPPLDEARLHSLRERSAEIFTRPYNRLPVDVAPAFRGVAISSIRRPNPDTGQVEEVPYSHDTFNIFDPAHQKTALALADSFSETLADSPDEDGLESVLNGADARFGSQNSDLVKYALSVCITNDPIGRNLFIPPDLAQSPELFVPTRAAPPPSDRVEDLGGLGDEARLDYFREDPDFNSHHYHWHRVYPAFSATPKDRQGELFWYMHQQMLARYDAERIAVGLPPVVPLGDYRSAIAEGYRVDALVTDPQTGGNIAGRFTGRPADRSISDLAFTINGLTVGVTDLEANRERLRRAARSGAFDLGNGQSVPLTPDFRSANLFGATLEADAGSTPLPRKERAYGGLHNIGHGFFSALSRDPGGVMQSPTTAVRDPVFYRWHRHIDDLFAEWQEHLPGNDLADGAPPVRLRKDAGGRSMDIGLALLRDLAAGTPGERDGTLFDGAAYGAAHFGGTHWDRPLSEFEGAGEGRGLTRTLETGIGNYTLRLPNGREFPVFHLDHAEFAYFFRFENASDEEQRVTARVFLAPTERAGDRRWWMEMDKFLHVMAPREKSVVYRPARLSSVVRKPARRPADPAPTPAEPNDDYCNCGWPYHMLLPRGREVDGMAFLLFVMLTDAVEDLRGVERKCGSVSFCGAKDKKYPDNRMMGYPFDRPYRDASIAATLARPDLPHVAGLDLTLLHRPDA